MRIFGQTIKQTKLILCIKSCDFTDLQAHLHSVPGIEQNIAQMYQVLSSAWSTFYRFLHQQLQANWLH